MNADKLRRAANRTVRLNANVALLCEHALSAADYLDNLGWKPISTAPNQKAFDAWIASENNPEYGRRACGVLLVDGEWFGDGKPDKRYGEYATHWMPLPEAPPKTQSLTGRGPES